MRRVIVIDGRLRELSLRVWPLIDQIVLDFEERIKAFSCELVDDRVRAVDTWVNAFEARV